MLLLPCSREERLDGLAEIGIGRFWILNVLEDSLQENLVTEIKTSLPAVHVIRAPV